MSLPEEKAIQCVRCFSDNYAIVVDRVRCNTGFELNENLSHVKPHETRESIRKLLDTVNRAFVSSLLHFATPHYASLIKGSENRSGDPNG